MNIFSSFRLSKYAYGTIRMPVTSFQHLFPVINLSTDSSPDFEHRKDKSETYSKSASFSSESETFGTLKKCLEEKRKEKFTPIQSRKSSENVSKKVVKMKTFKKDDSDVFGNLTEKSPVWYPDMYEPSKQDNDLSDDSVIVMNISKKFRCPKKYFEEMKRLVQQKKIKEALNLFEDMRRNFVSPLHSHFTYMIGVCGRIGFTEMAFKLLRQMSDRGFRPTPATITGVFNSCAESPFPEYGLKKARSLREKIKVKNWPINPITYRAMIKAFGKCGDLMTAFEIVDEMAKGDFQIDVETYSFLLMSCVTNKESGFTYAVEIWRKMQARKCMPNIFTFNLLLRAVRDCDAGPEEISRLLLQHWSSYSKRPYGFLNKSKETAVIQIDSGTGSKPEETKHELKLVLKSNAVINRPESAVTSLLASRPESGQQILELVDIKTPSDRLNLLGGLEGILEMMSSMKVKPDIRTFTILLECLPPDTKDEERLLSLMVDVHQIKPDVDFFNALIRRRNFRKDTEAAKNVLVLINKHGLTPNIMTFGVLALGCRNQNQATIFLSEMEKLGYSPNVEIMGSLLGNACATLNFSYARFTLEYIERMRLASDESMLLRLEKTLDDVRRNLILQEQGKSVDPFYVRDRLREDLKEFRSYYDSWLKKARFQPEVHPWQQYRISQAQA